MSNKMSQKRVAMSGRPMINEKPKNFKKSWGKLLTFCKPYYFAIITCMVLAIAGTVFSLIGPNKLSDITDIITKALPVFDAKTGMISNLGASVEMSKILDIAVLLICLYTAGFVLTYIQGFIMATVTQRISKQLRAKISSKINKLPLKYMDKTTHGDVLSRVTNDVDTISQSLSNSVVSLVSSISLLLGSLLMMFITNYIMAFAAVGASLIGFFMMGIIMSKSQKHFVSQQNTLGEINGHIEEIYSGHNVVKCYNAEKEVTEKFDSINKKLYSSGWKSQFFSGLMMPIMSFIGNFGYVVVCVVGAVLAMNGTITFGVIVAFMIYIRLFTQPMSQIAQAATSMQTTAAASERVFNFLDEQEMEDESSKTKSLKKVKGDVEFKNIKFGYDENKIIIKDFSAKIKAGQKVAIVGPTGAGKTTLVNLLMRFYESNSGSIFIDKVKTSELSRDNVHNLFGMVLQDTWLFDGTVMQNLKYSKTNIPNKKVFEACKVVGIDHFIKTLPQGYDTVLNESTTVSAGQKQLLTIARAMVQNSPMLILDEATSSVDTRTEVQIQQAMDKLTKGRTSFVIAHRLSTIKNADIIFVLRDGDIVECGNHKDLIQENGFYADLYNSQFSET